MLEFEHPFISQFEHFALIQAFSRDCLCRERSVKSYNFSMLDSFHFIIYSEIAQMTFVQFPFTLIQSGQGT